MKTPPIPHNERERLAALRQCRILDTPPDPRFDRLTRLACTVLQCPIAVVSLVDECRQWFKSVQGIKATETPRTVSFCAHAICGSDILEVPDARLDERFANNPAVTGDLGVVFYAGAPIHTAEGYALGTLCIVDHKARCLTPEQKEILRDLADCASDQIHLGRMNLDSQLLAKNRQLSAAITRAQALFIGDKDQNEAFNEILTELLKITDSESGFIGEIRAFDHQPRVLKTYACKGDAGECAESERTGVAPAYLAGLLDAVIAAARPMILNNATAVLANLEDRDLPRGLNSLVGIPIYLGEEMVAVLGLANRPGGYETELLDFIQPLLNTVAQLVDATRIKRATIEREQDLKRLSLVASQTDSGVMITRTDGGIEWINEGFVRISGHSLNTLHGARFWDVLDGPETELEKITVMRDALFGRRPFTVELQCYRKNGATYWARIVGNPLYDEEQYFQGYIAIVSDITSEHRQAELLRENERRLRAVIEGTRIGTWEWNIASGQMTFNERWASMIGYRLAELEPTTLQTWTSLAHPGDFRNSRALLERHFAGELDFYDCKYRIRHKRGHWVWVHDRGRVFSWSADGTPLMMSGTHADITDLVAVRQALESQQQQVHSMLSNLPGMVYRYELEQGVSLYFVSEGVERVTGYPAHEFLASHGGRRKLEDLIHPDDRALADGLRRQNLGGYQLEYRLLHLDGFYRWVEEIGRGIYEKDTSGDERLCFLDGFVWDVTERKIAQEALETEKNKLSSLYQMAPVGITSSDYENGTFVEGNPEFLTMLGYDSAELSTLTWRDVVPSQQVFDEQRQKLELARHGRFGPTEKQLARHSGELLDVVICGVKVEEVTGDCRVWTIVQNITEQKQLEKMKSELIAVVSHELRTPLTSIIGSLGLLRRRLEKDEVAARYRELVEIAFNNSHRLNMLVNDLLDMEKLMAGEMSFKIEILSVRELLQQSVEENQAYAEQHDVRLVLHESAPSCKIAVDRLRFQQVMSNLLSNAAKFSAAGQEASLCWVVEGDSVRIEVEDSGCGIPAEFHHRVFQKFSQVDSSIARKKTGTGLGLAITRELVERMNGAIGFRSQPGTGTTFFITFPVHSESDNPAAES